MCLILRMDAFIRKRIQSVNKCEEASNFKVTKAIAFTSGITRNTLSKARFKGRFGSGCRGAPTASCEDGDERRPENPLPTVLE